MTSPFSLIDIYIFRFRSNFKIILDFPIAGLTYTYCLTNCFCLTAIQLPLLNSTMSFCIYPCNWYVHFRGKYSYLYLYLYLALVLHSCGTVILLYIVYVCFVLIPDVAFRYCPPDSVWEDIKTNYTMCLEENTVVSFIGFPLCCTTMSLFSKQRSRIQGFCVHKI